MCTLLLAHNQISTYYEKNKIAPTLLGKMYNIFILLQLYTHFYQVTHIHIIYMYIYIYICIYICVHYACAYVLQNILLYIKLLYFYMYIHKLY